MTQWGTVADWLIVLGTLVLAAVAVFQETIRGWFYRPRFRISIKTAPPDCVAVPFTTTDGTIVADSIYLRVWVENIGNATARNLEVYAKELSRKRADETWERASAFPPMNLKWANLGKIYAPRLGLTNQQPSLAFDLMVAPAHRGHIIGPGEYQLDILVAAENARPTARTIALSLRGIWDADETRMLRDGIGASIAAV